MLGIKTKKRIREHKWNQHSNTSLFFKRLKEKSHGAIDDLTLIAEEVDEEQLREIFTTRKLEPLMRALMRPHLTRLSKEKKSKRKSSKKKIVYKPDKDRLFFLSFMYLTWSLDTLKTTLDNRWAREMYSEHEVKLREIAHTLWHERNRQIEKKTS